MRADRPKPNWTTWRFCIDTATLEYERAIYEAAGYKTEILVVPDPTGGYDLYTYEEGDATAE